MKKSLHLLKFETDRSQRLETHESFPCKTCGEEFKKPLFAVISSGCTAEEYFACPKCLSKISVIKPKRTVKVNETKEEGKKNQETKVEDKMEETRTCAHHSGYLKRRPKNTPIPEECLTCAKMIECISL